MRFAITIRRGGGVKRFDCNYGNAADAVFGALRKDEVRGMAYYSNQDLRGPGQQTLEIHVEPNAAFDTARPLSHGARLFEGDHLRAVR